LRKYKELSTPKIITILNNNCKMRKVAISTVPNFPLGYNIDYM